jgi:hypothetical protein
MDSKCTDILTCHAFKVFFSEPCWVSKSSYRSVSVSKAQRSRNSTYQPQSRRSESRRAPWPSVPRNNILSSNVKMRAMARCEASGLTNSRIDRILAYFRVSVTVDGGLQRKQYHMSRGLSSTSDARIPQQLSERSRPRPLDQSQASQRVSRHHRQRSSRFQGHRNLLVSRNAEHQGPRQHSAYRWMRSNLG